MTRREQRVIHAFINCVQNKEFSQDYAITLIEDSQRYGWLSDNAKEEFYALSTQGQETEPENYTGPIEDMTE